ncbi:MAG: HAD hydrolase-like protein [Christensenellales bacterium]|jgi:HAD superfamily hydrolase (TIGR01509 family)
MGAKMYRHVIWDFDGTLYDTYPSMVGALIDTLRAHGHEESHEDALRLMKISAGEALSYYQKRYGYGDAFVAAYRARRKETELDMCKPYPGALELLRDIANAGGQNYIYTHRGDTLFPMLARYGAAELFRECVTARSGFARKPDPAGILHLIHAHQIDPADAVMVGDRALDIEAGANAGIATCDYWDGSGPKVDAADHIARDFDELRAALGYN